MFVDCNEVLRLKFQGLHVTVVECKRSPNHWLFIPRQRRGSGWTAFTAATEEQYTTTVSWSVSITPHYGKPAGFSPALPCHQNRATSTVAG